MTVIRYCSEHSSIWDEFVVNSKNANFHLTRKFLAYHKNRFEDHSVLVFNSNNELVTLIPAHVNGENICSHSGLTYGGFVFSKERMLTENMQAMQLVFEYYRSQGYQSIYYKTIPHIYHSIPSEDDLYFLFLQKAELICRHVNPVIRPTLKSEYQERRLRMIKKALKQGVLVSKSAQVDSYWKIVEELLANYNTKPVHSLEEMRQLMDLFPENIRLYGAFLNEELIAGILVFETDLVCKFQYIAANDKAKSIGALDLLIDYLIQKEFPNKTIDFGTVTADSGKQFAEGLSNQKEGFGARATIQDHYVVFLQT